MSEATTRHGERAMPARYLFDDVFALQVEQDDATATVDRRTHDAALEIARREAHAAGVIEGRNAALDEQAARLDAAVDRILQGVTKLAAAQAASRDAADEEAVRLAVAFAGKLAPALMSREPVAEIEALLRGCLAELRDAPHLAIRVSDGLVDALRDRLDKLTGETGFSGRLVVIGDPDIPLGDGRIEWADGGVVRDGARIAAAVDEAVRRHLATSATDPKDIDNG